MKFNHLCVLLLPLFGALSMSSSAYADGGGRCDSIFTRADLSFVSRAEGPVEYFGLSRGVQAGSTKLLIGNEYWGLQAGFQQGQITANAVSKILNREPDQQISLNVIVQPELSASPGNEAVFLKSFREKLSSMKGFTENLSRLDLETGAYQVRFVSREKSEIQKIFELLSIPGVRIAAHSFADLRNVPMPIKGARAKELLKDNPTTNTDGSGALVLPWMNVLNAGRVTVSALQRMDRWAPGQTLTLKMIVFKDRLNFQNNSISQWSLGDIKGDFEALGLRSVKVSGESSGYFELQVTIQNQHELDALARIADIHGSNPILASP